MPWLSRQVLLRHGADTGEIEKMDNGEQQAEAKRKGGRAKRAMPLFHQASAGGHTNVRSVLRVQGHLVDVI
jgi:hypothetical protein